MKRRMVCFFLALVAIAAASAASARVDFSIGVGVYPYGPPPVVYQPDPYYIAPPVVYVGHGRWGEGDWHHRRGHHEHH